MWIRRLLPLALLATFTAGACNCGGDRLNKLRDTQLVIESPADGSNAAASVHFAAKATNNAGLQWVSLQVGTDEIASCKAGADNSVIECAKDFTVQSEIAQQKNGALTLTAVTKDTSDQTVQKSVKVILPGLTVKFVLPTLSQPNPPVASVHDASPVEVAVTSLVDLNAVQVTVDQSDQPLAQWRPAAGTASQPQPIQLTSPNIAWAQQVGNGPHTLKATASDKNGNTATATLAIVFPCASDADCSTGARCCTSDGKCNKMVGAGANCDCDDPCPVNEGCFPGNCGVLPRKCRPGCFPGSSSPQPYGTAPDSCQPEPQGGLTVPAFCAQLPAAEATQANKGGACAPADNCSVSAQNCPDAPLDRNSPRSATNPIVHYSCGPASPTTVVCSPAGNLQEGATNCADSCSDVSQTCAKGLICVTSIDGSGNPLGPPTCRVECTDPSSIPLGGSSDCPAGESCGQVFGPGDQMYQTGSCQ